MNWSDLTASLAKWWALVVDVWDDTFLGLTVGNILVALAIMALAFTVRSFFTRVVVHRLRDFAQKSTTEIDDFLIGAIEGPVRFVPIVIGFFLATQSLNAEGDLEAFFFNLDRSLITILIFWTLYRVAKPLGNLLSHAERYLTDAMIEWLVKALRAAFLLIGVAAVLEIWGIQVGPIIAGLGLFGVAVALGAQDLFKNLIAGLFIISERRFLPGDWILVDGVVEGTVEQIGFRTTTVRRFDKAPVYVPNAKLADGAVTNFGRMTYRRIKWHIGVEYRTTAEQLEQVRAGIENAISSNDAFVKPEDASTFVRVDGFGPSSIDILVYCFTRTTNWGEWLRVKEALAFEIKQIVEGAGTGFAFPSQSIYVESVPENGTAP